MANPPIVFTVDDKTDAWGSKIMSDLKQPIEVKAQRNSKAVREDKLNATLRDLAEFQEQSLNTQVSNNSMASALQAAGLI
jgi:hypothetical protein